MPTTPSAQRDFLPTRWTVVLAAADAGKSPQTQRALEQLARAYWFPLYAFIRRQGHEPAAAEDLTQEFFARLLEKNSLAQVDRAKGKFRSFLLASLKHFLANEADRERAKKRGGGRRAIALDALDAETRYALEPADTMTPERVFEQRWAWAALDQVLLRLREQYEAKRQGLLFEALKNSLAAAAGDGPGYANIAGELGMSEGAVAVAVHRLRRQYRKLLREQIALTVSTDELIDEEIRYLLACL